MPTGVHRIVAFVHPVLAIVSLGLLAYVASLGLRSRERGQGALRPRHARLAPIAYWLMIFNLGFGLASTWWLRTDLDLAASPHFKIALAIATLLTAAALVSWRVPSSTLARRVHPILGLGALLISALQVFFGLALLPL